MKSIENMGKQAKTATKSLALLTEKQKNEVLIDLSERLMAAVDLILLENQIDEKNAVEKQSSPAFIDRLILNKERVRDMAQGLKDIATLADPIGAILEEKTLPNGLNIEKHRVPIGVLAVIYESRPNVTIEIAGLCIKTSNAVILRGGSETIHSNRILVKIIQETLLSHNLPVDMIQFIDDPDRTKIKELLELHEYIDLIIPRGSAKLHKFCRENSLIPVITGGMGVCHLFVDKSANQANAIKVIENSKIQKPSACNALDTVLVHKSIAPRFIPLLIEQLVEDKVLVKADEETIRLLDGRFADNVSLADADDFDQEWLSLTLGVKIVENLDQAIDHITTHSTGHSDGILTQDDDNANAFIARIDSAAVYVNASTRFTDGGQFGLGAEVAISTQKLHARGPMGLPELTSYKWVVRGDYTTRP